MSPSKSLPLCDSAGIRAARVAAAPGAGHAPADTAPETETRARNRVTRPMEAPAVAHHFGATPERLIGPGKTLSSARLDPQHAALVVVDPYRARADGQSHRIAAHL